MKKLLIAVLILGAGLIVYPALQAKDAEKYPSGSWRYKITVEVETPEGIKSGSAVREISNGTPRIDFPDNGNPANIKGEAVVIDLGKRGIVFGLVNDRTDHELYKSFPSGRGPTSADGIRYYNSLKPGMKAELPPMYYSAFVTFKDIKDPKTVTLLREEAFFPVRDKKEPIDNFEELFGAGVKLKGITVEITDEPVTWGIEKVLPWLSDLSIKGASLNGSTSIAVFTNELSDNLGAGSFSTGEKE